MNRLDMCLEVLQAVKKKMHVRDIAGALATRYPAEFGTEDTETLARKVSQSISNHIRSAGRNSKISKVPNGRGGHLSGMFRAKQKRKKTTLAKPPQVSNGYTGKAGEYGLLSELLFMGYNASIMTVDEGIDVVASRDNKYFHIQVKTANSNPQGKFQFTISAKSYKSYDASTTFYVLITHHFICNAWRSDYIVFQSGDITKLIATGVVAAGKQHSFLVLYEGNRCLLNNGNDITYHLNNFDPMK
ncbi:hypothetical protein [Desulfovibrio sp. Huiquan2017]|uniref:hypothetical protein n=1 Tax=Desulfovibrio sp. Huiquan2017 TaxID=2816861 RepID=UPI001A91D538|nr:hypothetical protein [Desulfovibrio sp. Huiquan2017]